jgi:hypothetical protein
MPTPPLDPQPIMDVGLGFFRSKTLLCAVELGLFSELARGPRSGSAIGTQLGLHPRATPDFLDGLVAMGLLEREGSGAGAEYRNTKLTDYYLDRAKPSYMGGILEMMNARLYRFWDNLGEALRTGEAQTEAKHSGRNLFETLYNDPTSLEGFLMGMQGASLPNMHAFAERFDFSRYRTLCDVGGASATLSRAVAARHPHLRCTSFDLPPVEPIAKRAIAADRLSERVKTMAGDFFQDPLPRADVITMGLILHDWNLETKRMLIAKAHEALPDGGAFVAIENLIDDERRENVYGLMMSLNMLMETGDGFDFTGADFAGWCGEAGFTRTEVLHLRGPASAAIAYK